ncbi:hypothetical protein ACFYO5_20155 [Streptomyces sp. NPDC006259]|uniref:hypothetical protein n=1 Tax=Streptomyces sp. NPDC006259 TaxID=3364740 RepID=UPI0036B34310
MVEQQHEQGAGPGASRAARRRRSGIIAFLCGVVAALAFFAFFPGLPHVIDAGAVVVSLVVGVLARWGCLAWTERRTGRGGG